MARSRRERFEGGSAPGKKRRVESLRFAPEELSGWIGLRSGLGEAAPPPGCLFPHPGEGTSGTTLFRPAIFPPSLACKTQAENLQPLRPWVTKIQRRSRSSRPSMSCKNGSRPKRRNATNVRSTRVDTRKNRRIRNSERHLPNAKKPARLGRLFGKIAAETAGNYFTPFLERRVPLVAPWRALNFGFVLQIT